MNTVTRKEVKLPRKMLPTQKVDIKELRAWCLVMSDACRFVGVRPVVRIATHLDGLTAFSGAAKLIARSDADKGFDISIAKQRGLYFYGKGFGPGKIVVNSDYFVKHLSDRYAHHRDVIAGVISPGRISPEIQQLIDLKKIMFVPFENLPKHSFGDIDALVSEDLSESWLLKKVWEMLVDACGFYADGLVFEVEDPGIKERMIQGDYLCGQVVYQTGN